LSAETNQNLFALDQMLIDRSLSHAFRLADENPEELSPDERMRLNFFSRKRARAVRARMLLRRNRTFQRVRVGGAFNCR
jgi:hypothetical protein